MAKCNQLTPLPFKGLMTKTLFSSATGINWNRKSFVTSSDSWRVGFTTEKKMFTHRLAVQNKHQIVFHEQWLNYWQTHRTAILQFNSLGALT